MRQTSRLVRAMWGLTCLALLAILPRVFAATLPDYMEHWEYGLNIDESEGPSYFTDVIFPVLRGDNDTSVVFVEPRVSYADSEWLTNLGTGYRQLTAGRQWLLGANMFYDRESMYSHYRLGWGVEALSEFAELRANYYLGLSQRRLIEATAQGNTYEEAVNGFDVEVGMPVPYYSRLKVFGGYNRYNLEEFKDLYGWTLRAEYTPAQFVVIDGTLSDDTKTSNLDWGMTVAFRIPLGANDPSTTRSPLKLDGTAFPDSDASRELFRLVERHHEIVVERERESGSVTVEVRRGT